MMHKEITHHPPTNVHPVPKQLQFLKVFFLGVKCNGIPLWPVEVSCSGSAHPNTLCPSAPHNCTQNSTESWNVLALYSTTQQQLTHRCVVNIVFPLKPEYTVIPGTMMENKQTKKHPSVLAETKPNFRVTFRNLWVSFPRTTFKGKRKQQKSNKTKQF